jgi:hypothetical protein
LKLKLCNIYSDHAPPPPSDDPKDDVNPRSSFSIPLPTSPPSDSDVRIQAITEGMLARRVKEVWGTEKFYSLDVKSCILKCFKEKEKNKLEESFTLLDSDSVSTLETASAKVKYNYFKLKNSTAGRNTLLMLLF